MFGEISNVDDSFQSGGAQKSIRYISGIVLPGVVGSQNHEDYSLLGRIEITMAHELVLS